MSNLIEILKKETESLRVQYLAMTENWAKADFASCVAKAGWELSDWCKFFGIAPRVTNPGTCYESLGFPTGFHNTSNARTYSRITTQLNKVVGLGLDKFIALELKNAEDHYNDSIVKLALRIEKKDLDQNNLKATTSHIGVNINTTITDGTKSVRAFTIIASGEIQRPHYRYLIK